MGLVLAGTLSMLAVICLQLYKYPATAHLSFSEYCSYHGYPSEVHYVATRDGYVLTTFRVQRKHSRMQNSSKPVVIL